MNFNAQGIMTILAAMVVIAGEILFSNKNKGTSRVVMESCIPSAK